MLEQVKTYMLSRNMVHAGDLLLVAVSGGPDSAALLHLLSRLAPELHLRLHVFHMDHGLRGDASRQDARYVAELAESLGWPCTVVELAPGLLKEREGSLQANAREVRYREMENLAHRIGAAKVALGHNRDDQAETVLMRFLRGAGPRGLAGIPPTRTAGGITYVRPLIDTPRKEIAAYCRENELSPRHDESNSKPDYLRNRLRLELIPMLARDYNPAILANLAAMATVIRDEDQYLETLAEEAFQRCRAPGEGIALKGSVVQNEPLAIARRIIRLAARHVAGPSYDLGLDQVNRVLEAAAVREGSHQLDLPGGIRVVNEYGICRFLSADLPAPAAAPSLWPISSQGMTEIPALGLQVEAVLGGTASGPREIVLDADLLPGPLFVRFRRPGDRMWPMGMEGSKKLQDIFVDAKVPQRLRDQVPLLVAGDSLLWVVGYRVDRRFLAGPDTAKPILIRVSDVGPKS